MELIAIFLARNETSKVIISDLVYNLKILFFIIILTMLPFVNPPNLLHRKFTSIWIV